MNAPTSLALSLRGDLRGDFLALPSPSFFSPFLLPAEGDRLRPPPGDFFLIDPVVDCRLERFAAPGPLAFNFAPAFAQAQVLSEDFPRLPATGDPDRERAPPPALAFDFAVAVLPAIALAQPDHHVNLPAHAFTLARLPAPPVVLTHLAFVTFP